MEDLDGEAAGSGEVKGPGPVHVLRFAGLHSRRLQPVVDFIDLVVGILHEAHVKPFRIGDLVRVVEIADSENETGVIGQYDIVARRFSDAVESEVLFKKVTGRRYIGDGKVDVVQFHGCLRHHTSVMRTCYVDRGTHLPHLMVVCHTGPIPCGFGSFPIFVGPPLHFDTAIARVAKFICGLFRLCLLRGKRCVLSFVSV